MGKLLNASVYRHCERSEAISSFVSRIFVGRQFYVYIMTSKSNTVLYTGVTNDLRRRVYEHKEKLLEGFTKKYQIGKLVYYEILRDAESAIAREKQIKGGSREKKVKLVEGMNPTWKDLYEEL
jgi:putative endonuclease